MLNGLAQSLLQSRVLAWGSTYDCLNLLRILSQGSNTILK